MAKKLRRVSDLTLDSNNLNLGTPRGGELLERSLRQYGAGRSVLADKNGVVIAGNKTAEKAVEIGLEDAIFVETDGKKLVVVQRTDLDLKRDKAARELAMADNRAGELDLDWDKRRVLASIDDGLDVKSMFRDNELQAMRDALIIEQDDYDEPTHHLKDEFLVAPFSVLDSCSGDWLRRKRTWWSLGFDSTEGRERGNAFERQGDDYHGARMRSSTGNKTTTDFDPVMAEVAYRWWCPKGGSILDPFSGGIVRGLVASKLGHKYTGIDVRKEQIDANKKLAKKFCKRVQPEYLCGGSQRVIPTLMREFDFIFSSPPYAGIEVHSDLEEDISNKDYDEFLATYRDIVKAAVDRLKPNRFACFVVGESRDKRTGAFKSFVPDTVRAFVDAGMMYYNEAVLVTPAASLGMMVRRFFPNKRKLAKRHQNVLVFYKGDPKQIEAELGYFKLDGIPEIEGADALDVLDTQKDAATRQIKR